jgi:hypothetical protein
MNLSGPRSAIPISQIARGHTIVSSIRHLRSASRTPNTGRNACTAHANIHAHESPAVAVAEVPPLSNVLHAKAPMSH